MKFWIFMFIMTLLVPFSLIFMWYVCPRIKRVNGIMGYRTSRSMMNQSTWDFAQRVCARNSMKMFFPTIILAAVIMPFCKNKDIDTIGWIGLGVTLAQLISYVVIIYLTESALKKEFDIGVGNDNL